MISFKKKTTEKSIDQYLEWSVFGGLGAHKTKIHFKDNINQMHWMGIHL